MKPLVPAKVALAFTAIGWLPRLTWSSQAICSVVVLAGLAASSPARLFKPGYLLCYGTGRADRGFWARLWPPSDQAPLLMQGKARFVKSITFVLFNLIYTKKVLKSDWLRKEHSSPVTRVQTCNTSANYNCFLIGWKHRRNQQEPIRLELF